MSHYVVLVGMASLESSNAEIKSLRAASDAVVIVDKENVDQEKCRESLAKGINTMNIQGRDREVRCWCL